MNRRDRATVALMMLATFFLFADQNLMAPNLTAIAREFGLSDVERDQKLGGDVALVFWMLGGVMTLGIGWLTDRVKRTTLFAAVVMVGAVPCFLTGYARSYEELYWMRAATGIGIGGAIPVLYSLLGDYYPPERRASATALVGLVMGLGIAVGQLVAGFVGPEHGWRLPFQLIGAPCFVIVPIYALVAREPARGATEGAGGEGHGGPASWSAYKDIFRVPTNVMVFLQGIPGTVPWGVFFVFLNDFYAQDKGYSVETATLIVMVLGGAAIFGGYLGGLVGQRLYNRHPRYLPLWCGATTLVGVIPTLALLNWPAVAPGAEPSVTAPLLLGLATGFTVAITGPNVRAILLNVNRPETRGAVFSLYNLADDLGRGFGPVIIGALVGGFGRVGAFNIATGFWVFCGLVLIAMSRRFPRDEAALRAALAARGAA